MNKQTKPKDSEEDTGKGPKGDELAETFEVETSTNTEETNVPEEGDATEAPEKDTASAGEIIRLQALVEEYKDEYLRGKAEVENTRRRSMQEVSNARKYGVERFARELLDVRDSLDQATGVDLSNDKGDVVEKMQEGLSLTLKQMDSIFEKFSISMVVPEIGDKFDPAQHQAMSMLPSDEIEPNHILTLVQPGYRLHDRLLRPAMVIVAKSA